MIIKIVFAIIVGIAIFIYLIILGANKCKTEIEKEIEDEEQIKELMKWRKQNDK